MLPTALQFSCRFLISFGKFGFALYLSKVASLEVLGQYGLIAGFSLMLVQMAGLELHYVNVRRLLGSNDSPWPGLINQLKFNAVTHLLLGPFTIAVCIVLGLPASLWPWVVALVVADHLSLEAYRYLVALQRPGLATLVLMVKSSGWMLVYVALASVGLISIGIESILGFWAASAMLGLLVLMVLAARHRPLRDWVSPIDLVQIRMAALQAWPFFVTAVAYALAQSLDRMLINHTQGAAQTGVYFFFLSLASGAYTLVSYPGALLYYPKAVGAFLRGDMAAYRRHKLHMCWSYAVLGAIIVGSAAVMLPWLLIRLDKAEYLQLLPLFWALMAAQAMLLLADFALLDIYVRQLDRLAMGVTLVALVVYIILLAAVPESAGLIGIAGCLIGFYTALWLLRLAVPAVITRGVVK